MVKNVSAMNKARSTVLHTRTSSKTNKVGDSVNRQVKVSLDAIAKQVGVPEEKIKHSIRVRQRDAPNFETWKVPVPSAARLLLQRIRCGVTFDNPCRAAFL